ncbi:MAG: hypothetical protein NTX92_02300 [Euryarchaeota archaeon]|nr:hypothetical protein [Euryarchaeota archaeon]
MKNDPEIVNILREEERVGKLQNRTSTTTNGAGLSNTFVEQSEYVPTNTNEPSRYEPKRTIIDLVSPQEKYETNPVSFGNQDASEKR